MGILGTIHDELAKIRHARELAALAKENNNLKTQVASLQYELNHYKQKCKQLENQEEE